MVRELFRRLYPFESRFWDRGGLKYHYLDEGRGDPVVMVHGNPTWSFYYRDLVKSLRDFCRVIVPDHIGCGFSDKPGDRRYDYTLESRVDDLEGFLDHLGVRENITLVVHDWGGMIGLAYACRHPGAIRRLVVMNTASFLPPEGKRLPWQLSVARTPLGPLLVRGLNAFAVGASHVCCARPMPSEVRAGYLFPYGSWKNRIAVLRFIQDIPMSPGDRAYDLARWTGENLHRLAAVPTLIGWGERDFVFGGDFLKEWVRRFPRAELRRFPDAGHYVLEDAPELSTLVRAFLQKYPLGSPV